MNLVKSAYDLQLGVFDLGRILFHALFLALRLLGGAPLGHTPVLF